MSPQPRILCFAPDNIAEMLDTLAMLHALRRHFGGAHLAVACESALAPLAQACVAVNEVIVLQRSRMPGLAAMKNKKRVRGFDWALAAKAGFDRKLAARVKLSRAKVRIGFEPRAGKSAWYTDPVALPHDASEEHRADILLRLLQPLGLVQATRWTAGQVEMRVPETVRGFIEEALQERPFIMGPAYVLINLASATPCKFNETELLTLLRNFLSATPFAIGIVAGLADQKLAAEIALVSDPERVGVLDPLGPLEFAALVEQAVLLVTMEDAAAHLAAVMDAPAVVVWPGELPFAQQRPRGRRNIFVETKPGDKSVAGERVWQGVLTLLTSKKYDIEKQWADLLQLPPSTDLS